MSDDPRFRPCCEAWRHAHDEGTDREGAFALAWYADDDGDQSAYISCLGCGEAASELPAVRFCPWCGVAKDGFSTIKIRQPTAADEEAIEEFVRRDMAAAGARWQGSVGIEGDGKP